MRNKSPKKVIGNIVSALLAIIFVAVLVCFIVIVVQVGQGKTPTLFGYRFYYILTDSMTPNLAVGDVIVSKATDVDDAELYTVGAVVTYTAESGVMAGNSVTHRIVEGVHYDESVGDYVVLTCGDKAGATVDAPVRLSSINAVMVRKASFMSWLVRVFRNGYGFVLIFVLPLAVMLVCLVIRLISLIKKPANVAEDADDERDKRVEEIKKQAVEEYLRSKEENKEP